MVKRPQLGLSYFFDNRSNSGVVNYIYNIVAALDTLPDDERPDVTVFYTAGAPVDYLQGINYPHIRFVLVRDYPYNLLARKANSLVKKIAGVNLYKKWRYGRVDSLYPYYGLPDLEMAEGKRIHWLVDFNNRAFPNHYTDGGESINSYHELITSKPNTVVLSSYALWDELKEHHPKHLSAVKILRFASTLPPVDDAELPSILEKHRVDMPYFMTPNQLWEHKNHTVVLEALRIVKDKKPDLKFGFLFTGSLDVNRGKGHFIDKLRRMIEEYRLQPYVSFLGVIERREQLLLMKHAAALVQPSLYEGWSTLVEEAKALNRFIILSDLPVHREQIIENVSFFNPHDAAALADNLISQLDHPYQTVDVDYKKNIREYGKRIVEVLCSGHAET